MAVQAARVAIAQRLAGAALFALCCSFAQAQAGAAVIAPESALVGLELRQLGEGQMRWFGFKIYDVRLLTAGPEDSIEGVDHALVIRYVRAIEGRRLVDTSIDEMRRLGMGDEVSLTHWRAELDRALPSVKPGETLLGLHRSGLGARFWHQGRLTADIRDPALARAFFAIWLDPRTREPALRARLLGLVP